MHSLSKFSLAALGGAGMLMLAAPVDAATGYSKFHASVKEVRRFCERFDEPFWKKRRNYGCGDRLVCAGGDCIVRSLPPPPHWRDPALLFSLEKPGDGGNDGGGSVRGGPNGGGGSNARGSAGGPN
jgi:hypothetical protein